MVSVRPRALVWTTLLSICSGALLGACAQSQSAAWASVEHLVSGGSAVEAQPLNPRFRYLRVAANGTPALLVLGHVEQDTSGRPVEVWASGSREVLRLQNGRLVGVAGTPVEWRNVTLPPKLPAWQEITAARSYLRQRDEMPGYRIGLTERVRVQPMPAPGNSALVRLDPGTLRWYQETVEALEGAPSEGVPAGRPLPPARYAVQPAGLPVYGEQCVAANFCLSWQSWPPRGLKD